MNDNGSAKKIAVLIDAENASHKVLGAVLTELSKHGHIIVKKAYGDWSSQHLVNWKQPLNDLAINPIQQFSYTGAISNTSPILQFFKIFPIHS